MSNYQSSEIKLINTSLIDPHPDNPRKQIGDVTDLANSIKANGLLSPLSVVPNGKRYRVIAGHRRLQACKQAGTGAVPCFVLDLTPLQQLEAMVTENCQREQLTVLEEADAIQGMLDLGATTADVAHRLGRSAGLRPRPRQGRQHHRRRRQARDDFDQLTIGQLIAISRYDGQPDRQERLTRAAGTSNFDYLLTSFERDDKLAAWFDAVAQKLESGTTGLNVIPDPENTFSDPEWRFSYAVYAGKCIVEDTIEEILEDDPAAVSIHQANKQIYLWDKRDKAAEDAENARIDAERAATEAERHALAEYAATSYGRRAAWLHANLHGIKYAKLVEATARLGLLQIIDPTHRLHPSADHLEQHRMRQRTIRHHQRHRLGTGARGTPPPPRRTRLGGMGGADPRRTHRMVHRPRRLDHRQRHQQTHPRLLPHPPRPRIRAIRRRNRTPRPARCRHHRSRPAGRRRGGRRMMMTSAQFDRLRNLLIDTAVTASLIELEALADKNDQLAEWAEHVRVNCAALMGLSSDLPEATDGE
mgnify:CR=1 FL=1